MSYVTVNDIRTEGVSEKIPDSVIVDRIALASRVFDNLTGRFFEKKTGVTFQLNGRGHDIIWLTVPPVNINSITMVKINDEELDSEYFKILMPYPDGNLNAKLKNLLGVWPKGDCNVEVTGDFGLVDENEETPIDVKNAIKRIVVSLIDPVGSDASWKNRRIIEETNRSYTYKLSEAESTGQFGDTFIDMIICRYRDWYMITI